MVVNAGGDYLPRQISLNKNNGIRMTREESRKNINMEFLFLRRSMRWKYHSKQEIMFEVVHLVFVNMKPLHLMFILKINENHMKDMNKIKI